MMTFKRSTLIIVLLAMMVLVLGGVYLNWPSRCSNVEMVNTSIQVKNIGGRGLIGFNTDTDSLKFGGASPGIRSKRTTLVRSSFDAHVIVTMQGDFETWVTISPAEFDLAANESKEISFEAHVPVGAADGDYTGKVRFCFKKKYYRIYRMV